MLIKVRAVGKAREMKRTADIFRGRIIVTEKTYTIELTGNKVKLDAFIVRSTAPRSWKPSVPAVPASAAANASSKYKI
jgi:acetolactate synthase small subunit